MRAYGELIANVAKTVDQFMHDNISGAAPAATISPTLSRTRSSRRAAGAPSSVRAKAAEAPPPPASSWPRARIPSGASPRSAASSDVNPAGHRHLRRQAELRIVTAARLQMAKSRQQLLASMVMLGINRIVVTDGTINAKVVFDMRAEDKAKRNYTALDERHAKRSASQAGDERELWRLVLARSTCRRHAESEQSHVATVGSAVDETSESQGGGEGQAVGRGARQLQERLSAAREDGDAGDDVGHPGQLHALQSEQAQPRRRLEARVASAMRGRVARFVTATSRNAGRERPSAFTVALDQPGERRPSASDPARIDQAQLRAIASLYLAAELEAAGVVPAVEHLTRLARTGALDLDLGEAAPLSNDSGSRGTSARRRPSARPSSRGLFGGEHGDRERVGTRRGSSRIG